ncbi:radical SAM protein [Acinetobacter sp.]|uniref:B12-binding domain-containing radical SAM protein n=1 Tax=Acinetobacter sp. TaxID=472 RepID=UPI000C389B83|nr:radical SAM protein [Acinetobacter sp.]MBC70008.1 hypothetical protein [Acinetobacter sp.]
MSKILLINPNKWGRGITHIWIASHSAKLKSDGHDVSLFDCTFYKNWTDNETLFNTYNAMYKPSEYEMKIKFSEEDIYESLQKKIDDFDPDFIFWSGLSSHIHGEGEYVNIQYGCNLIEKITTKAIKICGGLQATANPELVLRKLKSIDYLISGESELVLSELVRELPARELKSKGVSYIKENKFISTPKQDLISNMDEIPKYDYSLFDKQVFLRPYNGEVINAVDYELSRGCMFACHYCVETIIQKYYGFNEVNKRGSISNHKAYLRNKSAKRIFDELNSLVNEYNVKLIRSQDTNFLTINKNVLSELAELIETNNLQFKMYIETRPEGINSKSVELLKKLNVDGVGMGIELSTQSFREDKLRRFADTEKIINAFKLLKEYNINRTAYNIIGLPDQDEDSIIETIEFNRLLKPDNVTVAYYSPYLGTERQIRGQELGDFDEYEFNVDSTFRSHTKNKSLNTSCLNYYKENFSKFSNNNLPIIKYSEQHS